MINKLSVEEHLVNLYHDFAFYMAMFLFADYCRKQEDPVDSANELISSWKARALSTRDAEIKRVEANEADPLMGMFAQMFPTPTKEDIDETYIRNINRVVHILEEVRDRLLDT